MINKISESCHSCSEFFITKNPEILVVAGAIIAALGVVLYQNGIGSFSQMVGLAAAGLFVCAVFSVATATKLCLNKIVLKNQENISAPPLAPPQQVNAPAVQVEKVVEKTLPKKSKQPPARLDRTLSFGAAARHMLRPRVSMVKAISELKRNSFLKAAAGNLTYFKELAPQNKEEWLKTDERGMTVLHIAAGSKFQAAEKIAFILGASKKYGVKEQLISALDKEAMTPLHHASSDETVLALLANGAKTEVVDQHGRTPLLALIDNKQSAHCVKALLPKANVLAVDQSGRTALMLACIHNEFDVIELLVKAKKNKDELLKAQDENGETALHYAVSYSDYRTMDFLLAEGAPISITNKEDKTFKDIALTRWEASKKALNEEHGLGEEAFNRPDFLEGFVTGRYESDAVCREAIRAFAIMQSLSKIRAKTL